MTVRKNFRFNLLLDNGRGVTLTPHSLLVPRSKIE